MSPEAIKNPGLNYLAHVLTSLVTLAAAWLAFSGQVVTSNDDQLRIAFERISALEEQLESLRTELIQAHAQNVKLQTEMRMQFDHVGLLEQYLDALPEPAWIKKVQYDAMGNPEFRMLLINRAYEDKYRISRMLYKGRVDADIWEASAAQKFYENDVKTYELRNTTKQVERFAVRPGDSELHTRVVWKFIVALPNGALGIGGMVIDSLGVEQILRDQLDLPEDKQQNFLEGLLEHPHVGGEQDDGKRQRGNPIG